MATSGSVDHSVSRDNVISDALMMVGAIGPDDTAPATWVTQASRFLNNILKSWHGLGVSLWAQKTGYILPITDTNSILLGPSGGAATSTYVQTTLSAAASTGASTVTVTLATGIAASYYIGIELDDDTIHWTTVNGALSGTVVTLTAVLPSGATSGNYVYAYQTKIQRPIHLLDAYLHNQTSGMDSQIEVVAKSQYDLYSSKTSVGVPNQISYDPQLTNGVAYIAPQFTDGRQIITIIFQRPFEDFDTSGDTPDFPQSMYDAATMALAVRLAPIYGMPAQDRAVLRQEAKEALTLALESDMEDGSFQIIPDMG